jgi:hypothetical protein
MELERFAEIVDDMIIQHDYPGFEPRALKLGLPEEILRMHTKTFASALGHTNVYVKLAALRWFQERPGMAKSYVKAISGLFDSSDEFVRMESLKTVERFPQVAPELVVEMSRLLKDENSSVRKAAAKAVGKLASRMKQKDPQVVDALREASNDKDPEVRMKVQKAVRLIGA